MAAFAMACGGWPIARVVSELTRLCLEDQHTYLPTYMYASVARQHSATLPTREPEQPTKKKVAIVSMVRMEHGKQWNGRI